MAGFGEIEVSGVSGDVSFDGKAFEAGTIKLYQDTLGQLSQLGLDDYFLKVITTRESTEFNFKEYSLITATNNSITFSKVQRWRLYANDETVHLKDAEQSQIQQFLDALPASIKGKVKRILSEDDLQRQLREMQQREENLQRQLREVRQREENSQRQMREMQQREENSQRQMSEMQQREENLQRQLREVRQREENSQRQLREARQREENCQRQLGEMRQREENSQRQMREMRQREENSQRQMRDMVQREENSQRQLTLKDRQVNELQLSLSTAQQTVSELRRQETCDWVIARDEIQMTDRCLGRGGWGSVYEGKYCGCTVAVKQIHDLILSRHNIRLFEREMNIASKCRHPSLLQFIGATNDEGSPLFLTELMEKSLRALLERRELSETEIFTVSRDVAQALNYLHQKKPEPIIHRDVSSANVLLWRQGDQWRGKVSDYGTANFMQNTMTVAPGAMIYSAPEALTSNQTVKIDVYSFGVLLCEMCIGELPDPRRRDEQVVLVANHVFRDLVRRCLQENPEIRPNIQQILDELEEFNTTS